MKTLYEIVTPPEIKSIEYTGTGTMAPAIPSGEMHFQTLGDLWLYVGDLDLKHGDSFAVESTGEGKYRLIVKGD